MHRRRDDEAGRDWRVARRAMKRGSQAARLALNARDVIPALRDASRISPAGKQKGALREMRQHKREWRAQFRSLRSRASNEARRRCETRDHVSEKKPALPATRRTLGWVSARRPQRELPPSKASDLLWSDTRKDQCMVSDPEGQTPSKIQMRISKTEARFACTAMNRRASFASRFFFVLGLPTGNRARSVVFRPSRRTRLHFD